MNNNNRQKAREFEKMYIERMANVLFAFTPLIESKKLACITRTFVDSDTQF